MSTASKIVKGMSKMGVSLLSDPDSPCIVAKRLSTGCLVLDAIMGGGLPLGRITEVFGEYSSGKSLIAAQAVAMAQQAGILAHYVDTETTVSLEMLAELGVNVDDLMYSAPDTIEDVFTIMENTILEKNKIDKSQELLLVWDSVAASSAKFEEEAEYGKSAMGRHAQIISGAMRKFIHLVSDSNVYCLFLNQTRQKIGVMFGDNTTTAGGMAIGFYSSIRLKLDLRAKLKAPSLRSKKPRIVGMNTEVLCVKNKTSIPFRSATLPIYFGHGIDDAKATFLYLLDNGVIEQSGAKYTLRWEDGEDTFSKKSFDKYFDENYDDIADLVLSMETDTGDLDDTSVAE